MKKLKLFGKIPFDKSKNPSWMIHQEVLIDEYFIPENYDARELGQTTKAARQMFVLNHYDNFPVINLSYIRGTLFAFFHRSRGWEPVFREEIE